MQIGIDNHVAAANGVLADILARKVEGAAVAGMAPFGRLVLCVDRAHARRQTGRAHGHAVPGRGLARQNGAGDHSAGPGEDE